MCISALPQGGEQQVALVEDKDDEELTAEVPPSDKSTILVNANSERFVWGPETAGEEEPLTATVPPFPTVTLPVGPLSAPPHCC
jgi:hypothetical protein